MKPNVHTVITKSLQQSVSLIN